MPSYFYKAKKESAETVSGYITAADPEEAVDIVTSMGLLPVEVDEATVDGALLKKIKSHRISAKELYGFTRQLASLLKSGLPLMRALEILLKQTKGKYLNAVLSAIIVEIKNGRSFSEVLMDYNHVFSPLYVSMVAAGEESGKLQIMVQSLAVNQKTQLEIMSKIRSSMAYPLLMFVVGVATIIFILSYVMPKISVLFTGVGEALPWPTQLVMGASQIVQSFWYWGAFIIVGWILFYRFFKKASWIKHTRDMVVLQVPFLRDFFVKMEMERFCRTLHLLVASGVGIIKSISIATPTVNNYFIRRQLIECQEELIEGGAFGDALNRADLIPDLIGQLIAVGEESGSLDESLKDISETYQQEMDETTKAFTSLLEPLMILVIGLVVGFIVFAMLMPIFQMDILAR